MPPDEPSLDLPGLVRDRAAEGRAKAARTRERRKTAEVEATATDPVARVVLDLPLAHLDREFDYVVPATMADDARPGVRVKVRFAGKDVDGFLVERCAESEHQGRLAPLRRVVSPEPVLRPEVLAVVDRVAERYAGTRSSLLRLAVPPRHATVERETPPEAAEPPHKGGEPVGTATLAAPWQAWEHGPDLIAALARGDAPRAVWGALPGSPWPVQVAAAVLATRMSGRGSLVVVPDARDAARVAEALDLVGCAHVVLTAGSGPAQRYRDFLAVSRGSVDVVVGTRGAVFAPVRDLGLVVVWDDGDDLHEEPRTPYLHTREVGLIRAQEQGSGLLVGGHSRTPEAQLMVRTGVARELAPRLAAVRAGVTTAITGATDFELERDPWARSTRLPQQVHQLIRSAVEEGPVLVQVPRRGYAAALACDRCRSAARCAECTGPLRQGSPTSPPSCGWCGVGAEEWRCPVCGHRGLRAPVVGDARTAEELGRAFPGVRVVTSGGSQVRASVPPEPRSIVVATPGAEPVVEGDPRTAPGYTAVVLLDTWLALARPSLRVREQALQRWLNAVALVRPGGRALAVGDPADEALQALVRWAPAAFASRELDDRASAHLPPVSRLVTVTGDPGAVDDALTLLAVPEHAEVLGPLQVGEQEQVVVRVPFGEGPALSAACRELNRARSARKLDPVRVRVDPTDL
ncbi:MAG: primosomal protein N' [Nocardioidaceae bacterium]|nr:primosomal protein N' [Nocardioidaceae bacterium]MCL2612282.1 primosomal protein N' [Nocardioidaceae bacterium]